jgi:hypothetical protein
VSQIRKLVALSDISKPREKAEGAKARGSVRSINKSAATR